MCILHETISQFGRAIFELLSSHMWRMVSLPPINIEGIYDDKVEKAMATHSSVLAWKIPWTEEPGRLQSMGSLRVGQD